MYISKVMAAENVAFEENLFVPQLYFYKYYITVEVERCQHRWISQRRN